jgi:hypothetical protein
MPYFCTTFFALSYNQIPTPPDVGILVSLPPYIRLLGARGATRTRDPLLRKLLFLFSIPSNISFITIYCHFLQISDHFATVFHPISPSSPITPAHKVYIRYTYFLKTTSMIIIYPSFIGEGGINRSILRLSAHTTSAGYNSYCIPRITVLTNKRRPVSVIASGALSKPHIINQPLSINRLA